MSVETLFDRQKQAAVLEADQTIAGKVAETLHRSYPGHLWAVKASVEQGVVYVHNLNFSSVYGMVLHMDQLAKDPRMKLIKAAGGELLERYKVARERLTETLQEDIDQRPADARGELILPKDSQVD